jgi:hypothetical protein
MLPAAAALTLCACATTPAPEGPSEPQWYRCSADAEGAFGRIWRGADVPVDGTPPFQRGQWQMPWRRVGLYLVVTYSGREPLGGAMPGSSDLFLRFVSLRRSPRPVRIEMRRAGAGDGSPPFLAGAYANLFTNRPEPGWVVEAHGHWRDILNGSAGGAIDISVADDRGRVVARQRVEASELGLATDALAAVEPILAERIGDYRNRCEVPEPITVAFSVELRRPFARWPIASGSRSSG